MWDRDRAIEIVSSQTKDVRERFPHIPRAAFDAELQFVSASGETWSGARAVERVLEELPRGPWLGWMFALPFARPLAARIYRVIARNRYRLGCGEHCKRGGGGAPKPGI